MFITRICSAILVLFSLSTFFISPAFAASKNALVVAAFGSTNHEAIKSVESFTDSIRKERKDLKVIKAFTSREIVEKLKDGEFETPSVPSAISSLADEGYTNIGVLSLHLTPGKSYSDLSNSVQSLRGALGGGVKIELSPPLVANETDAFTLGSYIIYSLPSEIKPGEAVVFVGRGSDNQGSLVYPALNWGLFLQGEKGSLYMVMNLENNESVKQAMQILKLNRRKVVWLLPIMSVNGTQAEKYIFSTDDSSIASRLKDAGHTVRPYKQGLVNNPSVQTMWKARLKALMPPPEGSGGND